MQFAHARSAPSAASNFVAVGINNSDLDWMNRVFTSPRPRWPFSHLYYGPFISELQAQGASVVAFDMLFSGHDEARPFNAQVLTGITNPVVGTTVFAERVRAHGKVILGSGSGRFEKPVSELATNACALGHCIIRTDADSTGRRVPVFLDDHNGGRLWCLGFVLAARHLGLDLQRAEVSPGRLVLRAPGGITREVPLTPQNEIRCDWVMIPNHPLPAQSIRMVPFWKVLANALHRTAGKPVEDLGIRNALVLVGGAGNAMGIRDRGGTPLGPSQDVFLTHLNVANSLLTGRFIRAVSPEAGLGIAIGLTGLATVLGWRLRTLWASASVAGCAVAYVAFAVWIFMAHRVLLPVALPVFGALLTTHLVMSVCRTAENAERRHVQRLLKKVVSPKIIDTLLAQESPMPQTHRAEITVLFADLRGFTRYAEESQARAEAAARALELPPEQARAFADEAAREALDSVNRYLAAVVDEIKVTDGTLDKYMGDCVTAFWGAPLADAHHAAQALRCAIAAEQTMERINCEFAAENQRRERENQQREQRKLPPLPLLPVLRLGMGLNSGLATVGFVGSENHLSSYTAFGHVVNVASRVEGLASGGQIIATEHTILAAGRNHPELLARCAEQAPVLLKGNSAPLKVYEVQWRAVATRPSTPATA